MNAPHVSLEFTPEDFEEFIDSCIEVQKASAKEEIVKLEVGGVSVEYWYDLTTTYRVRGHT